MGEAKHFLIVLPTSLVPNWEKELEKWCPSINIFKYTGDLSKSKRNFLNKFSYNDDNVI